MIRSPLLILLAVYYYKFYFRCFIVVLLLFYPCGCVKYFDLFVFSLYFGCGKEVSRDTRILIVRLKEDGISGCHFLLLDGYMLCYYLGSHRFFWDIIE